MSETSETVKRAAERSSQGAAAVEAAGMASMHAARNGADHAKEAIETASETAADLSSRAAEQGREVLLMGMRTAASVGGRVADIGFGRGHHLLASATHAMDIYRDASERSAEQVQALFSGYMAFGRGLQAMQHAWLEMADHRMASAAHGKRELLRAKSVVELAEVQRDLYIDALNQAVESTSRMLEMAGRTAQDAVRSLRPHAH